MASMSANPNIVFLVILLYQCLSGMLTLNTFVRI